MIEAQLRTRDGRLTLKVQGESQKEIFRQIALAQDVFEAEPDCGLCHSKELRFRMRTVDSFEFYELVCVACGAQFSFGQHKTNGTLFPKRRDESGRELPNRGWRKYIPEDR